MQLGKALVFLAFFATNGRHFSLPGSAKITIGPVQRDHTYPDPVSDSVCKQYRLTEAQVRRQFRFYHELAEGEYHDYYLQFPCWIEGTLVVNGKTYTWSSQPGNTMMTTWPDGVSKTLGGKHTDDPSGEK
jgi:hypothetical protein